ncbi:sulfite exporter TauE/SafE family protein [Nesterenkonia rhizosphaerae]|uniref:Probable membrane transporter protein n=1 Tax=Nesterenkonia rhizosphaerae TaxID=1348272 RepID=A0ABP9FTU2_9MICC
MDELTLTSWLLLSLGALTVGLAKTAVPGAGTLAVIFFASALPARESTAALLVLLIIGDLFAIWMYRRTVDWGILRRLVWPVLAGVAIGTFFLGVASDAMVRRVIGAILLGLLGVTMWRRRQAKVRLGRTAGYGFGWLGGFTTMVANAGGPVMSLYLLGMRLDVKTFLGTAAYFFFAINLIKVPFHVGLGLLNLEVLSIVVLLVPLVVLSAFAGRWMASRIPQRAFEILVLCFTAAGAVYLLL